MDDEQKQDEPIGADAVAAASTSATTTPQVRAEALAYFMGEAPPPGSEDRVQLEVDFGTPDAPNFQPCTFKLLQNEEFDTATTAAIVDKDTPQQRVNPFLYRSFVFAYACVSPDLSGALSARRQQGNDKSAATGQRLSDTADLVREVFRFQPGVLENVVATLERRSRTGESSDRSVREVEAGKGSR